MVRFPRLVVDLFPTSPASSSGSSSGKSLPGSTATSCAFLGSPASDLITDIVFVAALLFRMKIKVTAAKASSPKFARRTQKSHCVRNPVEDCFGLSGRSSSIGDVEREAAAEAGWLRG